ncbi:hypothetical protein Dimus_036690, partial [Dionaea muscipula]
MKLGGASASNDSWRLLPASNEVGVAANEWLHGGNRAAWASSEACSSGPSPLASNGH